MSRTARVQLAPLSYTVSELATATGMSTQTIRRMVKEGQLEAKRTGTGGQTGLFLISAASVDKFFGDGSINVTLV